MAVKIALRSATQCATELRLETLILLHLQAKSEFYCFQKGIYCLEIVPLAAGYPDWPPVLHCS